jgi:hypothetical protein
VRVGTIVGRGAAGPSAPAASASAYSHGIIARSFGPTCSIPCSLSRRRIRSNSGPPARHSASHSRANEPSRISARASHGAVVALRRRREAGLDRVDAERVELAREAELLFAGQAVARHLFAVAQGRIEDQDVSHGHRRVRSERGQKQKRRGPLRSAALCHSEVTGSRLSSQRVADPMLTNNAGKRKADNNERNREDDLHNGYGTQS